MSFLPDPALERLREALDVPDLSGTRYRPLRRLGRGGMGVVWLAEDGKLGRAVALKLLEVGDGAGDLGRRLVREAQVLARLEHPGIVPVHDVGVLADGRVFYAMKHVEGERLDRLGPGIKLAERLRLLIRVCETVAFAHERGVLHRDLKPENVMVGRFGEVLVMDWGIAKVLEERAGEAMAVRALESPAGSNTGHGAVLGTRGYMPPEQARGDLEALDARSDVFALGAILHFLIAGSAPGETSLTAPAPPRPLAAIRERAMAMDPGRRYPTALHLAEEVTRYLDGDPVAAHTEGTLERLRRLVRRHQTAVALVATYVLVRALLLLLTGR